MRRKRCPGIARPGRDGVFTMSDSASGLLPPVPPAPGRGLYCNRTLNLRSIKAVGYDMDYTLVHYHVDTWERRAHEYITAKLRELGEYAVGLSGPVPDRQIEVAGAMNPERHAAPPLSR